jgi:DNA-directed RNA polymerase specialized sigma24 family protein
MSRDRPSPEPTLEAFDRHRQLLFEDVVQESYLRWRRASEREVRSPKAYLSSVVTRLCLDHLRSARVRRERYVGPWLPEPLVAEPSPGASEAAALEDSLSMAFLVLLESLRPTERAVFLLREVLQHLVAADTTASAIRCDTGQSRENNPAYVGGCAVPCNALQHFIYHSK